MKQKDVFLQGEGDAWFSRNSGSLAKRVLPDDDSVLVELVGFRDSLPAGSEGKVLEVGCGPGTRLAWLKGNLGMDCYGIEPSAKAVDEAKSRGLKAEVGTADRLPYESAFFDVVILGFCLYLCDRDDLFKIAAEVDRVLKNPGWVMIKDFYSPVPLAREYHHKAGVYSYKMDYRKLFDWNPDYTVFSHRVTYHYGGYTDDRQEWVATSVIRKNRQS